MDATSAVRELGGEVRATEADNVEALVNEILVLRQRAADAEDAEVRAERRIGREIEARNRAESRATLAEEALGAIEAAISRARRKALASGAPLKVPDDTGSEVEPRIAHVGEGGDYPLVRTG